LGLADRLLSCRNAALQADPYAVSNRSRRRRAGILLCLAKAAIIISSSKDLKR
jgi:hypothetical protein